MAALAVVPAPSVTADSLYKLEDHLACLIETAELVPADQQEQFAAEFRQTLAATVEKRDRVGQYMAHIEAQSEFADAEIKRLRERKLIFDRAFDRIEKLVLNTIEYLGKDAKGKYQKLEGKTITFAAQRCPASVDITDEAVVPAEYKNLIVKLPATVWEMLLDSLDIETRAAVLDQVKKAECEISRSAIKAALDAGEEVPGARVIADKLSLRRS